MHFRGAIVKEQDVTFAIVIVKSHILGDHAEARRLIGAFQRSVFGNIPVVLMAQNSAGIPTYFARQEVAKFLSQIRLQAIPWKDYTIA